MRSTERPIPKANRNQKPAMSTTYIVVAIVGAAVIPALGAAIGLGRVLGRLDGFKELFEQALEQWAHREGKQDEQLAVHEARIRQVERWK